MGAGELLERTDELGAIDASLKRAFDGDGGLILVEGPAGTGKSALLAAAGANARARGLTVIASRGGEYERALPFEIARQLFARMLAREPDRTARVLSGAAAPAAALLGLDGSDGETSPIGARYALYWLVANLADEKALLITIDDLQWADESSQEWVRYLARRLADLPVCLLASWRTSGADNDPELLDALRDEPAAGRLRPEALTVEAVTTLCRLALDDHATDEICAAAHRLTAGNPFLLQELLRAVEGAPPRTAEELERARPDSIVRGVNRRLQTIPEQARELAFAVSVLGDGCELRHAAALAGLDPTEAIDAADRLTAVAILAPGRPLHFEHPLVRAAVHDSPGSHRISQTHLAAANILNGEGTTPARVAAHLMAAPPTADPWVAGQLVAAGRIAIDGGAAAEGAAMLERALIEPPPADQRPGILFALARAESMLLRPGAKARYEEVIMLSPDPALRAEAGAILAQTAVMTSELDLMRGAMQAALNDARGANRELELRMRAVAGNAMWLSEEAREPVLLELDSDAQQMTGGTQGECLVLGMAAMNRLTSDDDPAVAIALAERAVEPGLLPGDDGDFVSSPIGSTVMTLLACDRLEPAARLLAAWHEGSVSRGSLLGQTSCLALRCNAGWLAGELAESEADGRAAAALLPELTGVIVLYHTYLARTLVDRGRLDEAQAVLQHHAASSVGRVLHTVVNAQLLQARDAHRDAAAAALELADSPQADRGMSCVLGWRLLAAVSLDVTGDQARARELLRDQRQVTEHWRLPRAVGMLERAEGLVESDPGKLERAAATLSGSPARLELARTLIDLGAMRRRMKERASAREALRVGLDIATRCAADGLMARAVEELAASGARPRRLMLSGVDALTASERRVARLAAEGRSNPEIAQLLYVSRKTVETHLGSVYRKLDVSSREALAGVLE